MMFVYFKSCGCVTEIIYVEYFYLVEYFEQYCLICIINPHHTTKGKIAKRSKALCSRVTLFLPSRTCSIEGFRGLIPILSLRLFFFEYIICSIAYNFI